MAKVPAAPLVLSNLRAVELKGMRPFPMVSVPVPIAEPADDVPRLPMLRITAEVVVFLLLMVNPPSNVLAPPNVTELLVALVNPWAIERACPLPEIIPPTVRLA